MQGWRFHFYSNEGNEPMHLHAVKGDAECKMQNASIRCIRTVSISLRSSNTTARHVCAARNARSSLGISIRSLLPGGNVSEGIVQSKTKPVLAKAIETTPEAL